jgi:hypothetical protein
MGGGGDHIGVGDGGGVDPGGHQAGDMGHVDHQVGPDGAGDVGKGAEIDDSRVGRRPGDDHLRPVDPGQFFHGPVIDAPGFRIEAVMGEVEETTGEADRCAVGQVAAVGKIHAHDRVPRFQEGEVDPHVRLGARMGLDIGILRPEEGLGPVDGQRFGHVDTFASAVIPFVGVPLGVLVGQNAPLDGHDRRVGDILRGDHLQGVALAGQLIPDHLGDPGIDGLDGLQIH